MSSPKKNVPSAVSSRIPSYKTKHASLLISHSMVSDSSLFQLVGFCDKLKSPQQRDIVLAANTVKCNAWNTMSHNPLRG